MPNIVKSFFEVKKSSYCMFSSVKAFSMMDWDSLKRWSSVDLAFLKPDWCLLINFICSRWDLSLCSMTLSNSFITELIRLMGL